MNRDAYTFLFAAAKLNRRGLNQHVLGCLRGSIAVPTADAIVANATHSR